MVLTPNLAQKAEWADYFSNTSLHWVKTNPNAPNFRITNGHLELGSSCTALNYQPIDFKKDFKFDIHIVSFDHLQFVLGADHWNHKGIVIDIDPRVGSYQYSTLITHENHNRIIDTLLDKIQPLSFAPDKHSNLKIICVDNVLKITLEQEGERILIYEGLCVLENGESWFGFYTDKRDKKVEIEAVEIEYSEYTPYCDIAYKKGEVSRKNLGSKINTNFFEIAPVVTAGGEKIWFTRDTGLENIYFANMSDGEITQSAKANRNVNQPNQDNTFINISSDGNIMYIKGYYEDGKYIRRGISKIEKKSNNKWSRPEGIKIRNFNHKGVYSSFFISSDGNILLLMMQKKANTNNGDLYVSFKESELQYSTPKHLGEVINTNKTEGTPFLAPDLRTLYFSSEGHPGYGSYDLFVSKRLDNTWTNWSPPMNLGPDINTGDAETYFSIPASGEYGFFVSNYRGKSRSDDIFAVKLPESARPDPVIIINGTVYDDKTGRPIGAHITYHDMETDKELGTAISDPKTGHFEIILPEKKNYSFYAISNNYYSIRESIDLTQLDHYEKINKNLHLVPIEKGSTIRLNNVFFVRTKDVMLPQSLPELNKLVELLNLNSDLKIQIEGHTDNTGDKKMNIKLSEDRANKVMQYLIDKGIAPGRLSAKGFGGSQPITNNASEEAKKLNRRVEFRIL